MEEFNFKKTFSVLVAAYIMGLLFGFAALTGVKPTEAGFTKVILEFTCSYEQALDESSCNGLMIVMIFVSIIGLIISIITHIKSANSFIVGLVAYGIGWGLGYISLFLFF